MKLSHSAFIGEHERNRALESVRNPCGECGKPALARGLCRAHYARAYRSKALEVTRRINSLAAEEILAEAIEQGRRRTERAADCLIWPFKRDKCGYASISGHKTILVCRLICEEVYGPPPDDMPWALHDCDRGRDGCIEPTHINWGNALKNNVADRKRAGTYEAFIYSRGRTPKASGHKGGHNHGGLSTGDGSASD